MGFRVWTVFYAMKHGAKRVEAIALIEGRTQPCKILCDIDYLTDNQPVAILWWGLNIELLGARYVPLNPALLFESKRDGVLFEYQNFDHPIVIPKALAIQQEPLTQEAFHKGFVEIG
jgi:hypothetical protein